MRRKEPAERAVARGEKKSRRREKEQREKCKNVFHYTRSVYKNIATGFSASCSPLDARRHRFKKYECVSRAPLCISFLSSFLFASLVLSYDSGGKNNEKEKGCQARQDNRKICSFCFQIFCLKFLIDIVHGCRDGLCVVY